MAEELGFEGVVLPDHVVIKVGDRTPHPSGYPVRPDEPHVDPFCAFSAMAAVTTTLRFMNYIYVVPLREPFTLAKQAASVALLSGNRFALGTGVGWLREEFETIGRDFSSRGRRTDEMLEIIRDFWDDGHAEFHGEHHDFPASAMFPVPTERIPILIGGHSMAAARRAARHDGYILMRAGVDDETRREYAEIDAIRLDAGLTSPFARVVPLPGVEDPGAIDELGGTWSVTDLIAMPWAMSDGASAADKQAAAERYASTIIRR
jgi:probable F420-dependent oxidoreductase